MNTFFRHMSAALVLATIALVPTGNVLAGPYADPTYVPLFVDSIDGSTPAGGVWYDGSILRSVVDSERSKSGDESVKVSFADERNFFGGWSNLQGGASAGETIWYRIYLYIPETASLASAGVNDYSGWGKFMMLSPTGHGSPRMYLQIPSPNQQSFGDSGFERTGLRIDSDGMGTCNFRSAPALPRNQWFSLQLAWKVGPSNGWARIWLDEEFIGECPTDSSAGFVAGSWGIGTYWNGGAWVKGSSTPSFWIDDIVLTKEQPNTTDADGRPYIHPLHFTEPAVRPAVFTLE